MSTPQYTLAQFMADTRIPYLQGRIIFCVQYYAPCVSGLEPVREYIDEALDIVNTLKHLDPSPLDVPADDEVEWLSSCVDKYLDCRAMSAPEMYCVRAAATLHLFPAPALAVLSNIESNFKSIKAGFKNADSSTD